MEIFSALLAICAGNSPVTGEFPTQRPVTRSFDVYFDLRPKEQSWGWWFETLSRSLWRHRNGKSLTESLALCEGIPSGLPVESPHKGPVMYSFDVAFAVSPSKLLNIQSSCQWHEP